MRKMWIELAGFAILLAAVMTSASQPPPGGELPKGSPPLLSASQRPPGGELPKGPRQSEPKIAPPKTVLEVMLEQALQNNPDIHVAEAKVREAEAELNRTRLLVTQKVVALNAALDAARANVAVAEARAKRVQELNKAGNVSQEELQAAEASLQQAKADLARLESETPYITGQQPKEARSASATQRGLLWLAQAQIADVQHERALEREELAHYAEALALVVKSRLADNPAADKIRAALNKPVSLEVQNKSLEMVLGLIVETSPNLPIQLKPAPKLDGNNVATARFQNVPFAVILQWYEDALPNHRAYVRDYGILFLEDNQRPPSGAVPLREFWKAAKTEPKDNPEKK